MRRPFVIVCSIATLLLLVCVIFWHHVRETGFSTRVEPTSMEAMMAGSLREGAIPGRYAQMKNPVASDEATLTEARAHFADHCAVCHGNNGDGKTMFGKGMYPRPPDLRAPDTQHMSDGEIYWTIKNGVRLSGMPAFGDPGDDDLDSWKLVCFIRHLPKMTAQESEEMKKLNPKTPMEMMEEQQEEQFLNGDTSKESGSDTSNQNHKIREDKQK